MPPKPRVFVDADVLFAGAASSSEHSASLVVLRLSELTLIDALTSRQVITEAERNLAEKLPNTMPTFRLLVDRCLHIVENPLQDHVQQYAGRADSKNLPILTAAVHAECPWLVTFNVRHFEPGHPDVTVLPPGDLALRIRDLLHRL